MHPSDRRQLLGQGLGLLGLAALPRPAFAVGTAFAAGTAGASLRVLAWPGRAMPSRRWCRPSSGATACASS